jgi:hypothetical protein
MENNTIITHSTLDEGSDFFITDKWGVNHHFRVSSFPVGTGLQTEAIEVADDKNGREPYIFNILSDFDSDKEYAELMMRKKIKWGVNVRYMNLKDGNWEIGEDLELAGRVDFNGDIEASTFARFIASMNIPSLKTFTGDTEVGQFGMKIDHQTPA